MLDYAGPIGRPWGARWPVVVVAAVLAACSHWTAYYCAIKEPFVGAGDWRDVLVLRVLPLSLVVGWCAWAVVVALGTRPRRLALVFLVVGLPVAVWCCVETVGANRRFESDRAQVAEWYRMAAEEEAAAGR